AALAMFATVACGSDDDDKTPVTPPTPADAPEATIVAAPASVAIAGKGALNVTLSAAATKDVVINVANADDKILTVAAKTISIAKGATTGTVAFTGVAEGSSKVSFTSADAKVKTADLTITVTKAPAPVKEYGYPSFAWGTYFGMTNVVIGTTTITSSCGDGEAINKPLTGNDDFIVGGVSDDKTATIVPLTEGIAFTISAAKFTSTNSRYDVYLYIDWNDDGKFDDATEVVKKQNVDGAADTTVTGTITIPATAVASSRCRIAIINEENAFANGIGEADSGYIMDFMYSK
ncbi:MAG: GEVED domain-containing protein, partial [Rikenellaceae bacterium]